MAERISGLSIDLSMDTAELSRSFTSIKDSFRDIKRSAQVNLNNIKFDDKSVDTYRKNVNELSKSFDNQKKNVDDLRKHYDKMVATHGEGSKEAQSARIEYNKQADELNKLGHAVENARTELHKLNVENSGFTKIGNAAETAGSGIQTFGGHVKDVGGSLTKWITAPVLGAITAAGGLTAAFGWKRLIGVDNARAQLQGMGYDAKEVEGISDEVSDAIQGGMMTMAEGTATAAGAMAAGVERGAELEKYLKLVDAAAVGANKPVGDMAMIFNRVQGSGKLMTQELNMIEDGMPGFSAAMAEHMGVGMEEFRKMVTDGEVTSKDFLDVMDGFAGGMAEAYSGTFSGMVQNTKAWIGILGENLLGGVFEQSKGAIKEFMDLLKSDDLQTWAVETGEKLGTMFTNVVEKIKGAVTWFINLSSEKQKLIGIISAVAVAAGPLLVAFGSIAIFVGGVVKAIAPLFLGLGKLSAGFTAVKTGAMTFGAAFPKLAGFIGLLTGPIGITIAAIVGIGTAFTVAYAKSETFRNIIQGLIQRFKEFIPTIVSFGQSIYTNFMNLVIPAVNAVKTFFIDMFQKIKQFWQSDGEQVIAAIINGVNIVKTIVSAVMPVITTIIGTAFKLVLAIVQMVWTNIKGVINGTLNVIMGLVRVFSGLFTGDFSKMWEGVKQIFTGAIQAVWNGFQLLFYGRIIKGVGSLVRLFSGSIRNLWTTVVQFFQNLFTGSVQRVQSLFTRSNQIVNNLVSMFFRLISNMVSRVLGFFRNLFSTGTNIISNLRNGVSNTVSRMRDNVVNRVSNLRDNAINGFNRLKERASTLVSDLKDNAINRFDDMVEGAKALPGKLGDAIKNGASKAVDGVKSLGNSMVKQLEKVINGIIGGLNSITSKLGITATIKEWSAPQFSTGTGGSKGVASGMAARFSTGTRNGRIANDMLGIVNDKGPGNGRGGAVQELIEDKAGNLFAPRGKNVTVQLDKGDRIYSGAETQSLMSAGMLPKFSQGTGVDVKRPGEDARVGTKKKGIWGTMKDILENTFDYIKNPGKVMEAIISNITSKIQGISGFALNMAKGGFNFIKDNALKFITDIFKKNEGGLGQGKRGRFMNYRMTTPYSPNAPVPGYPASFNGGRHFGIDYGTPVGTPVHATLPGKVSRMSNLGGGIVAKLQSGDITQFFMHLSSVLKTGAVAMGDMIGKTGNTGKWTTGPHIHWQAQKGSQVMNRNTIDPRKVLKGHAKGGYIQKGGLFNLHDNEYVLPMNEPTEAMKLLALVGKDLAGKSKQTRQLPNVGAGSGTNETVEALKEIAMNQQTQIDQMTKAISVLLGIEDKAGITEGEIGRSNDKYNNRESNKRSRTTGRLSYV